MLHSRVSLRPIGWSALSALLVLLLVGVGFRPKPTLAAPTATIVSQGFETGDSWTIVAGSGNISSATGSGDTPANQRILTGSNSWQVNDETATLDLSTQNIGACTGVSITVRVSSTSGTTGNGAEASDEVELFVDVDGGGFPATADIELEGAVTNNARWGFDAVLTGSTTAGTPITLNAPQSGTSTNNYSTLTVTIPDSANSVALRIRAQNSVGSEYWNIDDIVLDGACGADTTPPTVTATTPTDSAIDVAQSSTITINFSEAVTVAAGAFSLECPSGTPASFTVAPALPTSGASAVVLTPDSVLPNSTTCTVTAIATNITDEGGNNNQLDGNGDGTGGDNYVFTFTTAAPQSAWSAEIDFSESVFQVLGASPSDLADGFIQDFDIVAPTNIVRCDGNPLTLYTEGQDGINDLRLTVGITDGSGGRWNRVQAEWSPPTGSFNNTHDFRSSWQINAQDTSQPNDYGLITFDFEFINGVQNSIAANDTDIRVTSTNGSSEAYEWAFVTANGTIVPVASIGAYSNIVYSDVSGTTNINDVTGAWEGIEGELNSPTDPTDPDPPPDPSLELPNNKTMAEHLTTPGASYSKGGLVGTGWWAVDDHNTNIFDALEQGSENPDAGNGATDDNQTITGADFDLAAATLVDQLTVYFGLVDVAFNTNPSTDSTTKTNTLPSAGVEFFNIGYDTSTLCTTAIALEGLSASITAGSGVEIQWQTAAEIDHAGFNVYRSSTPEFERSNAMQINAELIAAQGSFGQGASYSLLDDAVPAGVWYYFLEDVDVYGVSTTHDPVRVDTTVPTSAALSGLSGDAPGSLTIVLSLLVVALVLGTVLYWRNRVYN